MERFEALFEKLNYAGPARLKNTLNNRVIPFTIAHVERLATGDTVRQTQQAGPPLKGKVASHYLGCELQADLIDWTTAPSGANKTLSERAPGKGEKYILIVHDVSLAS